jgi:hypothetical protein
MRWSPYGSTRTYVRERIDQKKAEYDGRIQNDKEKRTKGQCKIQKTERFVVIKRNCSSGVQ